MKRDYRLLSGTIIIIIGHFCFQIAPYVQNKGRRVVARKGFKEGEYVCEYSGKLLSDEEGTQKECEYEVQSLGCYSQVT